MKLFIFGLGYSAGFIAQRLASLGIAISTTTRTGDKVDTLAAAGYGAYIFSGADRNEAVARELAASDAVLISVPPGHKDAAPDPVLEFYQDDLANASHVRWIGYLSTIGVYGDHAGGWVDESTAPRPLDPRSHRRLAAERQWVKFGLTHGVPVQVFRLAGIYGPGRNQLVQLAQGTARRIIKPGQVFNRIHVEDIAQMIDASLRKPRAGAIYNGADDEPAPPQDVLTFAAQLCGVAPPPEIPYATPDLSPMSRSFFSEVKRVRNSLLGSELGISLRYPTYREGLTALRLAGEGPP